MERSWIKKMEDTAGATLVFALVVFLIVSMMAVVVVNTAMTALKNSNRQQEEEQKYLSVTSAIRIFDKEITSKGRDLERCAISISTGSGSNSYHLGTAWRTGDENRVFPAVVLNMLQEILEAGESASDEVRTLTLAAPTAAGQMQEVEVKLTMDKATYDIEAEFSTSGAEPSYQHMVRYACEMVSDTVSDHRKEASPEETSLSSEEELRTALSSVKEQYSEEDTETTRFFWHIREE